MPHVSLIYAQYIMKWVARALTLIDVVPTVIRITVLWALIALVMSKFHSNRWRSIFLGLIFLGATWMSSSEGEWVPRVATCSALGGVAALTEAYYIATFPQTWTYAAPRLLSLPVWLFPLWSLVTYVIIEASPAVTRLVKELRDMLPHEMLGDGACHKLLMM